MKKKIYTRAICLMVTADLYNRVKSHADEKEVAVSDVIRMAIETNLSQIDEEKKTGDATDKDNAEIRINGNDEGGK